MSTPSNPGLYSFWRSSASYRVRIALAIKGLRYDYLAVDLLRNGGEQNQPAYRGVNAQGRVPALAVDGHVLTQSMAILEYLEEAHPAPALLPGDIYGRARVRALANIVACDIQPLQNLCVTQYLQGPLGVDGGAVKTWLHEWIGRGLAALEASLERDPETGRFCHGDRATLADVCLVPQCYSATRFGIDIARYPNIARIDSACSDMKEFRQAAPDAQPDAPR